MGAVAYVLITATPAFVVYISVLYWIGSPLLAIVPAGICWGACFFGFKALRGDE